MYIHIGKETMVHTSEIIGIFDLDNTTVSRHSRKFLSLAEKRGEVESIGNELPKSFVLCRNEKTGKRRVLLSPISTVTLLKRSGDIDNQ